MWTFGIRGFTMFCMAIWEEKGMRTYNSSHDGAEGPPCARLGAWWSRMLGSLNRFTLSMLCRSRTAQVLCNYPCDEVLFTPGMIVLTPGMIVVKMSEANGSYHKDVA